MGNYTVDNGRQQVTIYPYQDLTSYEGNQLFYGVFKSGVLDAELTAIDGSELTTLGFAANQVVFKISAGTSMMFARSYTPSGATYPKNIIGKVVLDDDAYIAILKTTLWTESTYITGIGSIIITADWAYSLDNPSQKYVDFEIHTDASLDSSVAAGKLILGEFLNQQYFALNHGSDGTGVFPLVDVKDYHVQYTWVESQPRNLIKRAGGQVNNIPVIFAADGNTVSVGPTVAWDSDTLMYSGTSLTSASVPLRTTIPNGHVATEYYQIDVLRLMQNEETQVISLTWSSFLKAIPGSPWDFTNLSTISQATILNYLNGFEFPLVDSGKIILFGIRNCNSIPTSGPTTTTLWPQQCYVPDYYIPQLGAPEYYSRWKLPIYDDV